MLLRLGRVALVAGVLGQREQSTEGVGMTTPSASAFDPQAFEGTAEYYAVGRPPYSAQLADTVARELSLDGTGQLSMWAADLASSCWPWLSCSTT